jgi:hypothetical protein
MQHHNLIHRHRSKTILDHAIQKQDYSWSCKTLSSSLSTWTLLGSIPNPVLIICDRRERAQLLWVSHSYPFRIACLTFLASMFPFCKPSLLSLDILHHKGGAFSQGELLIYLFVDVKRGRNMIYKNYFRWLVGFVIKMHSFLHSTYLFNLQYSSL